MACRSPHSWAVQAHIATGIDSSRRSTNEHFPSSGSAFGVEQNPIKTARHLVSARAPNKPENATLVRVVIFAQACTAVQHRMNAKLPRPLFLFLSFVGQLQKTSREGNRGLHPRLSRGQEPLRTNISDRNNSAIQKCLQEKMGRRGLRWWEGPGASLGADSVNAW